MSAPVRIRVLLRHLNMALMSFGFVPIWTALNLTVVNAISVSSWLIGAPGRTRTCDFSLNPFSRLTLIPQAPGTKIGAGGGT